MCYYYMDTPNVVENLKKHNIKCKSCGGRLKKFSKIHDWDGREYHLRCYKYEVDESRKYYWDLEKDELCEVKKK